MVRRLLALPVLALSLAALPVAARQASDRQPAPVGGQQGGIGNLGALSGLLGGGLPDIGATGVGNAAGLLGYCVRNNLLGGATAQGVLGSLTGRPGVSTAPGYAAGEAGRVQAGGSTLSLDALKGQVKQRVCSLVLSRAKSLL